MKEKWWKYPLAVIVFAAAYFLIPLGIAIAWGLVNMFSPNFYKSSTMWIMLASEILGVLLALELATKIVKKAKAFQIVLCIICVVYAFVVGITNYLYGTTDIAGMVNMLAGGIAAIGYAVHIVRG